MDPHCNGLNGKLENVLKRAARFMTRNNSRETGSMTGIFEELKWEILQLRKGGSVIGPYYCKKVCEVKSKFMRMTLSQNRRCSNQHSMAYQISYASKDAIRKASIPKLSGIRITSPILSSPLLNCRTTAYQNSLPF